MGFEFGYVDSLDARTLLWCFLGVILFVVTMDFSLGLLEHMLSENPLYGQMFRIIYKELMMMGIVSFLIIMYEASQTDLTHKQEEQIKSVDFSHILLFYSTIFFVLHGLVLIRVSVNYRKRYRDYFRRNTSNLILSMEKIMKNCFWSGIFKNRFFPFSPLRSSVEFRIVQTIFESHYYVPVDFDFAEYLSGCFAKYSWKIINRSLFTWVLLAILLSLNYARMAGGFRCLVATNSTETTTDDESSHRYLQEEFVSVDSLQRILANTVTESLHTCRNYTVNYYLAGGLCLCVYFTGLLLTSRVYRLR
jgi:hypothetical protein